MSARPEASSLSGAAGRRRRSADVEAGPAEVARRDRRVDARVVGVGHVVEHEPHALRPGGVVRSCLAPQPASAAGRGRQSRAAISRLTWGPPGCGAGGPRRRAGARRAPGLRRARPRAGQHDGGSEGARRLEVVDRGEHEVAEARRPTRLLGEHGADDRDRDGDLRAADSAGSAVGASTKAQRAPARGAERPQQLAQRRGRRLQAVERRRRRSGRSRRARR